MAGRRTGSGHVSGVKILVDMNLSPRWAMVLRESGFEAVHWSEVGRANAPDTHLMSFAAEHEYIVLTHDLDFGAILAATHGITPSVVQIRSEDLNPDALGESIIGALLQMQSELEQGALLTIEPKRVRLRLLPLRSEA